MGDVFKAPCFIYFMNLCVFILTQSYVLHERSTFILYALGSVLQSLRLYLVRDTRLCSRKIFRVPFGRLTMTSRSPGLPGWLPELITNDYNCEQVAKYGADKHLACHGRS